MRFQFHTSDNFEIDTSLLYGLLHTNHKFLTADSITEFRNRLEEFVLLTKSIEPEVKFSPQTSAYIKNKYNMAYNNIVNTNIFYPEYFFNRVVVNTKNLSEEEVKNFKKYGKSIIDPNWIPLDEDIDPWWQANYDIYRYDQKNIINVNWKDEHFQYFFTWYLVFLDPFSLNEKFVHTFFENLSLNDINKVLEKLKLKFPIIGKESNFKEKINFIINMEENQTIAKKTEAGRPKKDFLISRPIKRTKNDNITSLGEKETALLFYILRDQSLIINNKDIMSDSDLAKIVSALCGYSADSIRKTIGERNNLKKKVKEHFESFKNIRSTLVKIISLIPRELD